MKLSTEKMTTRMRASWRVVLESLLRITRRVKRGLDKRVQRLPAA